MYYVIQSNLCKSNLLGPIDLYKSKCACASICARLLYGSLRYDFYEG